MTLYHFTAAHMLPKIKREGLTLGRIPWRKRGKTILIPGYQWLTSNPEFDQSRRLTAFRRQRNLRSSESGNYVWSSFSKRSYSRTESRLPGKISLATVRTPCYVHGGAIVKIHRV